MVGDLADDRGELSGRHMRPFALVDIPQLHEDFGPRLRSRPAVQRGKETGLDLGDVTTRLDGMACLAEREGQVGRGRDLFEQIAESDILARRNELVDVVHLSYSYFIY